MSSRSFRARLDRVAAALGEPTAEAPVCRFHGTACRLGLNWPLPYVPGPLDDLLDLMNAAPHPRQLWAVDRHERVPPAELAREKEELAQLIAEKTAENDRAEAAMRGDDY
ncbi:hypothetical protein ACFY2G_04295 [Streptomyces collinus]|uniref:hypothetical protein n=1 Tax=Streptomyces collinus TaxID=42684 RepID=UPI00369F4E2A